MRKELELHHLAPYLRYRINPLKIKYENGIHTLDGLSGGWNVDLRQAMRVIENVHVAMCKPLLRPLSDFNKLHDDLNGSMHAMTFNVAQLEVDSDLDVSLRDEHTDYISLLDCYNTLEVLFQHHFDVFGLIDDGLAIDINTL